MLEVKGDVGANLPSMARLRLFPVNPSSDVWSTLISELTLRKQTSSCAKANIGDIMHANAIMERFISGKDNAFLYFCARIILQNDTECHG